MLRNIFEVANVPSGYSVFAVGMAFVSFLLVQAVRVIAVSLPLKEGDKIA
ncbi:hypothetical protein [Youngiibacter fragilis]|nr:hypothetical protein [Youngiibacter fragilis]